MPRPWNPLRDWVAGGLEDNVREGFPIDNRQAEVAMDWLMSQTAGSDATAARHTDARSLAVPVPRGTLNQTDVPIAFRPIDSRAGGNVRHMSPGDHRFRPPIRPV
jgi:hypothetical protein